jgi:hypothetical protein
MDKLGLAWDVTGVPSKAEQQQKRRSLTVSARAGRKRTNQLDSWAE